MMQKKQPFEFYVVLIKPDVRIFLLNSVLMNKLYLLFCFTLPLFASYGQTGNTWNKKASFGGLKREKAVAFSIDSYGYVCSGIDTAENVHNDLWQYDPELDTWTQLASLPGVARKNAISFTINGKGYVGTGFDNDTAAIGNKLKDFWEYNPLDNTWLEKAHYPGGGDTGIYQATAFSVLGKGYVSCGKIGPDAYISETWEYDPSSDAWIERTPFPGGDRYQLTSFVLEGKAFVGLGTDHDVFRKDIWQYDPTTNTWENKPDFPGSERSKSSSFSIGTKAFVVFGSDGGLKDELWEYSYYSQSWAIKAPFPGGGRKSAIAFSIGDKGYAGIGKEFDGKKQSFYQYTPSGPLSTAEITNKFELYPNPITSVAQINLPQSITEGNLLIVSMDGKIVKQQAFYSNSFTFNRSDLKNGTYQMILFDHNQNTMGFKSIFIL